MLYKIGISTIIFGCLMFVFGVSLFTYTGNLNDITRNLGLYSFVLWLPILILGDHYNHTF